MSTFQTYETAWCPGCGNFSILRSLKQALESLGKQPHEVVMVAGIGQAAKTPQYLSANSFCGLHGRSLPAAVAAKMSNEKLTVIVNSGEGDTYGEGGNHFIHNIRRNVNIAHFVHDNQIYGLTKGQASPTTAVGQVTSVQTNGSQNEAFNPMLMAIAAGAGFVARGFSGDPEHLADLMKQAIEYDGYALVDIFQPCTSFNKVNTFGFYKDRCYRLGEEHDPTNKMAALEKAMEYGDSIPIGVLYNVKKDTFHEKSKILQDGTPLLDRQRNMDAINDILKSYV